MGTTRLYFTASAEEQWRTLAGPWLREQAGVAWKNPKPTVILTPSRAESFYLRSRLVGEAVSFLGLRFWTPSDARKFLLEEVAPQVGPATQAELRLVARACAEKLAREDTAGAPDTLTSVIREPGAFLRAYDLLLGTGWDPAQSGAPYGRPLAREMRRSLEKFKVATQAGLHRHLLAEASSRKKPSIARLLVIGFNAAHWPLWDLLKSVVIAAQETVVALSEPRVFAEEIDHLWTGSWEEVTGTEALSPPHPLSPLEDPPAPFTGLVASYEQGQPGQASASGLTFLVTPDLASQIRGVVLQALDYLQRDSCTRLGLVFPEADALALGVGAELARLGIPLDDGTGAFAPGLFERLYWQSWIALQEEPSVRRLIAWLRAGEAQGISFGVAESLSAREIAELLESALGESLVDDLNFLALHLEDQAKGRRSRAVAEFLRGRIALPDTATFAGFLTLTRRAMALPGWESYLARLEIDPPGWLWKNEALLSRRTFLEWLKESTDSRARIRGAEGNHFYGKVHLLVYAQMTGQTWSHLILTGLNEGVWPRVFETGAFGSRQELAALNQQARKLNRAGTTQGRQGQGHEAVQANRGHCLLPLERQDIALRDLCAALDSTSEAACLAAMTTELGRSLLPSDFLSHAYQATTGRVLDEETFRSLANARREWCREHEALFESKAISSASIAATQAAYAARRDPARSFGPCEFAFAQPPAVPIQLSCKRWEDAWNHPATVWLEEIVGASSWPEGMLSWPRAMGTWAHRWLAAALRECRQRNSTAELPVLVWAEADREAARVRDRARAANVELSPWWDQVWGEARTAALGLGETLPPLLSPQQFLEEFTLPSDLSAALPGTSRADLILKGRIDLLLVEPGPVPCDPIHGDLSGCACWVIDFKTGAAKSLSLKKVGEGTGLQTVLYALAVRALGAGPTAISLHTGNPPLKPQVQLDAVLELAPLFHSLDILHRAGIFGMRPDVNNAYGYSPSYPMATRFVPADILQAKWALVHGGEAGDFAPTEEGE
jgi:hypothetical protein